MSLLDRYLNAVAAQLPRETRDDIIAELRDELETTLEARAAEKGRPLTDDEVESVLRDMGHPLTVAARFGAGPNQVVGPELYPWWMFGVRAALTVMVCITVIGAIVRVLAGDTDVSQAIGQGFYSLFNSAIMIVGFATIAAFIIERQATKPKFLTEWRVKDLSVFEWTAFGGDNWTERLKATASGNGGVPAKPKRRAPPALRAAASAFGWTVVLLWWTGLLGGQIAPANIGNGLIIEGFDSGRAVADTVALAYWPVIGFAATRILFDVLRVVTGSPVRLTALGDILFGAAAAWGVWWLWMLSPISGPIRVDDVPAFVDRVQAMIHGGGWAPATWIMIGMTVALFIEGWRIVRALAELTTGKAWPRD